MDEAVDLGSTQFSVVYLSSWSDGFATERWGAESLSRGLK